MAKKRSGSPSGGGKRRPPSSGSSYEVGYGKPPKKSRFKKGVSGNPLGRKRRGLRPYDPVAGVINVLMEGISIRQGDKSAKIPVVEALARMQLKKALEGSERSTLMVIKMLKELDILRPREPLPIHLAVLTDEELSTLRKLYGKMSGINDADQNDSGTDGPAH